MKKEEKIQIDSITYNNNLNFYTMLKLLIQCHLSEKQLINIQKTVRDNVFNINKDKALVRILLIDNNSAKTTAEKYSGLSYFLSTIDTMDAGMWCEFLDLCIDLLLIKDLILQESKVYVNNEYKKELKHIQDLLSIDYDISSIRVPYGKRVISSLLLYAFTNATRNSSFILSSSDDIVENISKKTNKLTNDYQLNVNNMFHIIMDESMNQSIKSEAGISYERRVAQTIAPLVDKLFGHSHDSKISSVEYDNTFIYNNKLCGISAKRTLRERYKQNLENVDLLDVDYMFVITLGNDLNEDKLNNILQKNGIYVIVSQEEYDARTFLNSNKRVISSKNIEEAFRRIIV